MSLPLRSSSDDKITTKAVRVAYLGPEASFSHQAALNIFSSTLPSTTRSSPKSSSSASPSKPSVTLTPLSSFAAIFSALQSRSHSYSVVPVENSTNGSVVQVLDLFAQCGLNDAALYPDLEICAEYYLDVHHYLFVSGMTTQESRNSLKPDVSENVIRNTDRSSIPAFANIRTLYTHPQVWGQCNKFLSKHFTGIERIDVGSTSAAAQIAATDSSGYSAAIASQLAGTVNNLHCLAENVEDDPDANTTRFLVVKNRYGNLPTVSTAQPYRQGNESKPYINYKSLLTFTIPHSIPGSLADVLAVFKQFEFNLTSIETRPSRQRNWHYVFFVECEEKRSNEEGDISNSSGQVDHDDGNVLERGKEGNASPNLRKMLAVLQTKTESIRYLGSWIDMLQS